MKSYPQYRISKNIVKGKMSSVFIIDEEGGVLATVFNHKNELIANEKKSGVKEDVLVNVTDEMTDKQIEQYRLRLNYEASDKSGTPVTFPIIEKDEKNK